MQHSRARADGGSGLKRKEGVCVVLFRLVRGLCLGGEHHCMQPDNASDFVTIDPTKRSDTWLSKELISIARLRLTVKIGSTTCA